MCLSSSRCGCPERATECSSGASEHWACPVAISEVPPDHCTQTGCIRTVTQKYQQGCPTTDQQHLPHITQLHPGGGAELWSRGQHSHSAANYNQQPGRRNVLQCSVILNLRVASSSFPYGCIDFYGHVCSVMRISNALVCHYHSESSIWLPIHGSYTVS